MAAFSINKLGDSIYSGSSWVNTTSPIKASDGRVRMPGLSIGGGTITDAKINFSPYGYPSSVAEGEIAFYGTQNASLTPAQTASMTLLGSRSGLWPNSETVKDIPLTSNLDVLSGFTSEWYLFVKASIKYQGFSVTIDPNYSLINPMSGNYSAGTMYTNVSGVWKLADIWTNVSGSWKKGEMWTNVSGTWKKGTA